MSRVIFFDNLGCLLAHIDYIDIDLLPGIDTQFLSLDAFNLGAFIFGSMLNLTMTPPTHSEMMIW